MSNCIYIKQIRLFIVFLAFLFQFGCMAQHNLIDSQQIRITEVEKAQERTEIMDIQSIRNQHPNSIVCMGIGKATTFRDAKNAAKENAKIAFIQLFNSKISNEIFSYNDGNRKVVNVLRIHSSRITIPFDSEFIVITDEQSNDSFTIKGVLHVRKEDLVNQNKRLLYNSAPEKLQKFLNELYTNY